MIGTFEALDMVHDERERQRELIQQGKFNWDCGSSETFGDNTEPNPFTKLAVLAEEFGEVSREVCEGINKPLDRDKLRTELVQVAAVCVAWIESL